MSSDTKTETHRGETRWIQRMPSTSQGAPEATRSQGRGMKQIFSQPSGGTEPANTSISDFWFSEPWHNTFLLFKPPSVWYFCYGSLSKLIQILHLPLTSWLTLASYLNLWISVSSLKRAQQISFKPPSLFPSPHDEPTFPATLAGKCGQVVKFWPIDQGVEAMCPAQSRNSPHSPPHSLLLLHLPAENHVALRGGRATR